MCEQNLVLVFFKNRKKVRRPKASPIDDRPLTINSIKEGREVNLKISLLNNNDNDVNQ